MREVELNAIFDLIPDPEKNYVNVNDREKYRYRDLEIWLLRTNGPLSYFLLMF